MSDKTITRYRRFRCEYESIAGTDIYRDCVKDLSGKAASLISESGRILMLLHK